MTFVVDVTHGPTTTDAVAVEAPVIPGFIGAGRYRRVECAWLSPADGAERLWVEIRSDLPMGALAELPLLDDFTYLDIWTAVAPHVRAWNALGLDIRTGEYRPVPPPAEMGPDAFKHVDPLIGIWIGQQLQRTYLDEVTSPKVPSASPPSVPTPKPASAAVSASDSPAKPSRRNRKGSPST